MLRIQKFQRLPSIAVSHVSVNKSNWNQCIEEPNIIAFEVKFIEIQISVVFIQNIPLIRWFQFRCFSSKSDEERVMPKNLLEDKITAKHQPNGPIVDNKPFKIALKAGQRKWHQIDNLNHDFRWPSLFVL